MKAKSLSPDSRIAKTTHFNRLAGVVFGVVTLLLTCTPARSQEKHPSKLEIGANFTAIAVAPPTETKVVGPGGRITFNLTNNLALEAEGNYLPSSGTRGNTPGGSILQGQFGLKACKRWDRFGLFVKARPGFVSFDGNYAPRQIGTTTVNGMPVPVFDFARIVRSTYFSMDLGGVVEVYPSRRVIVRFDLGKTLIHYGAHDVIDFSHNLPAVVREPGHTTSNFQFSSGVSFQLLMPKDENAPVSKASTTSEDSSTPRFEVGAHFTSLTFNPPRQFSGDAIGFSENHPLTETGFGGRFTFNLNNSIAVESVLNYFPTANGLANGATGRVFQGQFGVKAGKRFKRFGFFGKARPGFVAFTQSLKLVGTRPFIFDGRVITEGIFEIGRRYFYANDFGGVLEFYPTRRWSLRFDIGDTIIHYGERSDPTFFISTRFVTVPPEKHHNFQFISGFAFRF